jgi:hypothetical protein
MSTNIETPCLDDVVHQSRLFLEEFERYEEKPTKAASKNMRSHLNNMKKWITGAKQELIAKDKAA